MRRSVALLLLTLVATAGAQKLECRPPASCARPVLFLPEPTVLAEGGTVAPDAASPAVGLRLKRSRGEAYTLTVERGPWAPASGLVLEARYTVTGQNGRDAIQLDWAPVDESPRELLSRDERRSEIAVEYRLRVAGGVPPAAYEAVVTYTAWDAVARKREKNVITHVVRVVAPAYLLLRLDEAVAGSGPLSVVYDYEAGRAVDYVRAVETGTPLPFTAAGLARVAIATNAPNGYTVDVAVTTVTAPAGAGLGPADVLLRGAPAAGATLVRRGPTDGFETLVLPEDLTVRVEGDEEPGSYRFQVTYVARANP